MGRQQKDVNQDQAKWRLPSLLHHCVDSEYLQCKPTCRNDDNCLWTVPVLDALICNGQANIITGWKESNSIWPNRSETVQPSSHPQPPPPPALRVSLLSAFDIGRNKVLTLSAVLTLMSSVNLIDQFCCWHCQTNCEQQNILFWLGWMSDMTRPMGQWVKAVFDFAWNSLNIECKCNTCQRME